MCRIFSLFFVFAALLGTSPALGQTAPTIEVKLRDIVFTVPFQHGVTLYMPPLEGKGRFLKVAIQRSDRSRQYIELQRHREPVQVVGLFVDIHETCKSDFDKNLCAHKATFVPGSPYIANIFFSEINELSSTVFKGSGESVFFKEFQIKRHNDLEYALVQSKTGNKFNCPRDGVFGICRSTVILSNKVSVILNFARKDNKLDTGLANQYLSALLESLKGVFKIKQNEGQ